MQTLRCARLADVVGAGATHGAALPVASGLGHGQPL